MTKPRYKNALYFYLRKVINSVLPLEMAHRAAKRDFPEQMQVLEKLDSEIYHLLLKQGLSEDQIEGLDLMAHSWDSLQFEYCLAVGPNQVFSKDSIYDIENGIEKVKTAFKGEVDSLKIPYASRFRYFDLIRPNDMDILINEAKSAKDKFEKYEDQDSIPLLDFPTKIREPILLYPGTRVAIRKPGEECLTIDLSIDIGFDASKKDIKGAVSRYIYEYAKNIKLMGVKEGQDTSVAEDLINEYLYDQFFSSEEDAPVQRWDNIIPQLVGIKFWDLREYFMREGHKDYMNKAKDYILNRDVALRVEYSEDALVKNYKRAKKEIESIAKQAERDASSCL